VVFLNEREAAVALGWVPETATAVIKRGADGAEVRAPDGTATHPGYAVDAVDTTGAGDAFAAGYIAARLAGDEAESALATANACGALTATMPGARVPLDWTAVRRLRDDTDGNGSERP
jgi:ribokinase